MVFKNLDRRFASRFHTDAAWSYTQTMRGPELRGPGLRLRWNKVGDSVAPPDGVMRPSEVMIEMAQANMSQQLSLGLDDAPASNWILAHSGTPKDGLLTLHLAVPDLSNDGVRLIAWRESVAIFSALDPAADLPIVGRPGLPEPVELPDLEISFLPDVAEASAGEE